MRFIEKNKDDEYWEVLEETESQASERKLLENWNEEIKKDMQSFFFLKKKIYKINSKKLLKIQPFFKKCNFQLHQ